MKVTYQTCCGVDVHKSFLVATIVKTTGGIEPSYLKKRFSTFNNSILEFKQWLLDNHCRDVCMESTGKYWVPVFNLLEDEINVVIANPKWVKATRMMPKIRNGLGICSVLDLSKAAIFLVRKSVFSGNTLAIVTSLFPAAQVKRIDIRMLLLFVMLH